MNKAIVGKKIGMSQIFNEDGKVIPVTVVEAGPCPVVQKKTVEKDGYEAIQVAFGTINSKNVNKPVAGHYKKAGVEPKRILKEFKFDNCASYEIGAEIKADIFAVGDKLIFLVLLKVKVLVVQSKDTISTLVLWHTVLVITEVLVLWVLAQAHQGYSRTRKCQVNMVTQNAQFKTCKL